MARTPLLAALAQLAREHFVADGRGLPVDAVREARARRHEQQREQGHFSALTRRGFIGASAAVAGTLAAPRFARAQAQPRIAIIGAGISGLCAALKLADNGIASTVYEANDRVGGRMYSNNSYFEQGQVFEWCGELIDSGHTSIRNLADRFGLPLDNLLAAEPANATDTFYFFGQYYAKADADNDFKTIVPLLRDDLKQAGAYTTVFESTPAGRMLNRMSLYDWIEWRVPAAMPRRWVRCWTRPTTSN